MNVMPGRRQKSTPALSRRPNPRRDGKAADALVKAKVALESDQPAVDGHRGQIVVDADGHVTSANAAASLILGFSETELRTMNVAEMVKPVDASTVLHALRFVPEFGPTSCIGVSVFCKKQDPLTVNLEFVPRPSQSILVTFRDVTDHEANVRELQRSIEAHSVLTELCGAAIVTIDAEGRITYWNPAAEQLFGYTANEILNTPVTRLIPEHLRQKHLDSFRNRMESGGSPVFGRVLSSEAVRKNGTPVAVEVHVAVGRSKGQAFATSIIRDVSGHKQMLEALNDARQMLEFHVQCMPLAYIVWDREYRVVEWSRAAEKLFGYSKSEAVGMHALALAPPERHPYAEAKMSDTLRGETTIHAVNENIRKDGTRFTCEWFASALRDSAGLIYGVTSIAWDVSQREEVEARIRDSQKLESLGVLASGVAHDFNSSLMVMLGHASLLRAERNLSPRTIDHLDAIEQAGQSASRLIKHLLTYARTGRHNPQPTNINEVIRDSARLVRSSLAPNHFLKSSLESDLPLVEADRSQVEQVLLNLCLNAKQAMAAGGEIEMSTRSLSLKKAELTQCVPYDAHPGRYVEIAVSDTGCGMDAATVRQVFDPFFTTKSDGHGLGLAAVLGILRQHRGAVRVESQIRKGTSVRVYFPVMNEAHK